MKATKLSNFTSLLSFLQALHIAFIILEEEKGFINKVIPGTHAIIYQGLHKASECILVLAACS